MAHVILINGSKNCVTKKEVSSEIKFQRKAKGCIMSEFVMKWEMKAKFLDENLQYHRYKLTDDKWIPKMH